MIKVAKFGGSSMADGEGFLKIAEWLQKDRDIKAVVLSAGGKTVDCKKVTDLLLDGYENILKGKSVTKSLQPFYDRVRKDAEKLGFKNFIDEELKKIGQGVEKSLSLDFILSRGEYVYAKLFAKFYGMRFVDSESLIKFNDDGVLNLGYSEYKIKEEYTKNGSFITGGFYGSKQNGEIKTFSRGGGDFSGAIVSKGLLANEYLNFTDVDGVYQFDPKIANNGVIGELSYELIRILGEFGASVLHPASVLPLYGTGIKIRVKNTFNFLASGTLIAEKTLQKPFAVAIRNGVNFLKIKKKGLGYQIFKEFCGKVKVICSAVTLDFFEACYDGRIDLADFSEEFLTEYAVEERGCECFYLSENDKSKEIVCEIEKLKIALFTASFDKGYYVVTARKNGEKVIKTISEN